MRPAVLSRAGWVLTLTSFACLAAGRLFGLFELFLLGSSALVLVVAAFAAVARIRPRLDVERVLRPPRVHAGTDSRVELSVRNAGHRRTGVLQLHDPVTDTAGADLLLGPLAPGAGLDAAYQLPTERRGIVRAGPLEATASDPFGLARRPMLAADMAELTVLPRVDQLAPLPHTIGRDDPHAGADHPNVLGQGGEDFYALRQYVVGDDLRRVHWPSTARRGELMVRQDEVPWQGRATVLLDTRRHTTSPESFELAVSAAASIVTTSARHRDLIRLVLSDGTDSGYSDGHAQVDAVMEQLAVVDRTGGGTVGKLLGLLGRSPGGALVAILAVPTDDDLDALLRLRGRFGVVTVVLFERSSWDAAAATDPPNGRVRSGPGVRILRVTREGPFDQTWNHAMTRPGSRRARLVPSPSR